MAGGRAYSLLPLGVNALLGLPDSLETGETGLYGSKSLDGGGMPGTLSSIDGSLDSGRELDCDCGWYDRCEGLAGLW